MANSYTHEEIIKWYKDTYGDQPAKFKMLGDVSIGVEIEELEDAELDEWGLKMIESLGLS